MIHAQYAQLYAIVADSGCRYFETSIEVTMAGTNTIAEPPDHLGTVDVIERLVDSSGRTTRLRQMLPQERSRWAGRTGQARRFEFVDDTIYLYSIPFFGDIYIIRYIPQPPDITAYDDNNVIDVVNPGGEDFMIWGFCVRALAKVKSDVTLAMAEREKAGTALADWARQRAFNESPRRFVEDDGDGLFDSPDYDGWYR